MRLVELRVRTQDGGRALLNAAAKSGQLQGFVHEYLVLTRLSPLAPSRVPRGSGVSQQALMASAGTVWQARFW
jgi:hypothetical protein